MTKKYEYKNNSRLLLLRIPEGNMMESSDQDSVASPEEVVAIPAAPAPAPEAGDLTDDLEQRLEDIINTYQTAEGAGGEPADAEEVVPVVTATKHSGDSRRDQKLEKKMLKNLGG